MRTNKDSEKQETQDILRLLESNREHAWRPSEIAQALGLRGKQITRMRKLLQRMTRDGQVAQIKKGGAYTLSTVASLVTAPLRMMRNGAGQVIDSAGHRAVWIETPDLGTALHGDIVTVRLYQSGDSMKGEIIRVVERSSRDIVGTLTNVGKQLYVMPLNPVYRKAFLVPENAGANLSDRVVMRFTGWSNPRVPPEGEIIEVIGPADTPSLDTLVVMRQFDLPEEFPAAVIEEAERAAQRLSRPGKREDLRGKYVITIDPASARDFDDALSLEDDAQGNRVLGVHIADVTHFVRPGTALDREAWQRGTSVYLVDKVVPMLPEQLSNGVCSLRPGEERLCFSVFITFDASGKPLSRRFAKTRVRSSLRLDYAKAMAAISGQPNDKTAGSLPASALKLIRELWRLASQLRSRRFQHEALDLQLPEVEIVLAQDGRMSGMAIRPYDESHQLIEECMVAANEAVATELWTRGIKIITRLHEPPDPDRLEELRANLGKLGIESGNLNNPAHLAGLIRNTQDHPLRHHLHTMVLRSMKNALYSAEKIGHYGLAKKYYAHFTAPIRRYPDLALHRQLAAFLLDNRKGAHPPLLAQTALQATEREQIADDASRQLIEIKKFRFLQQQLDDRHPLEYRAVVAKVTNYGLFIDLPELAMGGLVHISTLSPQFVRHNPVDESLRAGSRTYRIGSELKVYVAAVDFDLRRADFVPSQRNSTGEKAEGKQRAKHAGNKRTSRK